MLVGILEDNQAVAEIYQLAMNMEGYESRVFALPILFIDAIIHAAPGPYLETALMEFIRYYNQTAKPINWTYTTEKLEQKLGKLL